MHSREYIDAHVVNVWADILNNLERKRIEGSQRRFFAPVDPVVIISYFNSYMQILKHLLILMEKHSQLWTPV